MLFNLLVFASFAKLQHNTESEMRGAVRECGYLGDAKKMYQNVASHLEQTSTCNYKWQCVHACVLFMWVCICVWVPCSLKPAFVSFSFDLKPPLGRPWPLICKLLWAYPSSLLLLLAHISFLGMFAGILHVNPLKLASLHLTVRPIYGKLFT